MKILPVIIIIIIFAGGSFSSCRYNPVVNHPCDTCNKPCDTCNINRDSLVHIQDSLSHAFTWTEYLNAIPSDADNHFSGVWVFGPNDIIICGASLWHFDGMNFTIIPAMDATHHVLLTGGLSGDGIFAFSKTDFWVTAPGGEALHTGDGLNFDDFRFGGVNACWGISSNDMFFVGNGGSIYHYDGMKFDTMKSNTTQNIGYIWGTDDNNIWACNTNIMTGEQNLLHYNGSQWTSDPFANSADALFSGLYSVWTIDSAGHQDVVASGNYVFRKTDNNPWRKDVYVPNKLPDSLSYASLFGLCGNSANDMWAGSWNGWAGHWNGKTWMRYDSIYDPKNQQFHTFAVSSKGNTVCMVGDKNGQKWIAVGTRK